jgi:pimeloyl-ACP methyl ester carboxylesterase
LDELEGSPATFLSDSTVVSITKQDVLDTIFGPIYQPQLRFSSLATTLAEAMAGNFSQLYKSLGVPDDRCPIRLPTSYTWSSDASKAIACGDGLSQENITIQEFQDYLTHLKTDSPDFGAAWSGIRLSCLGWRIRPKYRFSGPWITPEADSSVVEGKPAAPLLFISSRYDPVTPLSNAYEVSKSHPGSRVLVQDNVGHGSLFSPGKCREDFIKRYFETGEMPPKDTVCAPDCKPFQDCPQMGFASLSQETEPKLWSRQPPLALI